jgi:glycosyltransferase involved in cell wall biosynthesis
MTLVETVPTSDDVAVVRELRILSIYEGFFTGGARVLHSDVVAGLHTGGRHQHAVLSIHQEMRRETILQRMEDDRCYRMLTSAGVAVDSLGRRMDGGAPLPAFSDAELAEAARHGERADLILALKEQPLRLLNQAGFPRRPIIVCLHRSDPENQGTALAELRAAVADGRVVACICCAESTRDAYRAAGIPGELLHVIPNGVDLTRFRPVAPRVRAHLRRSLGVPVRAKVVAFAARYDYMKNVPLFLRSARAFLKHVPNGHVVMCGAGMSTANVDLCADLETVFADEPRLLHRLHLLGVRHDMENVYGAADVVTLTSRVGEAAPLCLIEGAMCGAIPVTTDVGDSASIVSGIGMVAAPDPDVISAAWSEAITRRAELTPALVSSRERFSMTRMIASYSAVIDREVARGRALA